MKKATSQDVARLAGVSQSAVSSILNNSDKVSFSEETRAKVLEAAKTLGYQLPKRKKNAVRKQPGLLLVLVPTLSNHYYAELGRMLESYADTRGIKTIVCSTFRKSELEKYYLELFLKLGIDGIVYTFLPSFPKMAEQIDTMVPVVLIGEKEDNLSVCSIELSNIRSANMLGEHLYELGHRSFAFVSTPLKRTTLARQQRLAGIQQMMRNRGLQKEALEIIAPPENYGESESDATLQPYEYTVGRRLTESVLRKGTKATAFVAVNDMTAIGIADALHELGYRIPGDYSVCGFDNIFTASITTPAITTIDHQLNMRCKAAIDIIITRVDSGNEATISQAIKIEYVPQLIVRGSTGPAAKRE